MDAITQTRPPRGAVVVVVVGLIATLAAAVLATDSVGGSSVEVEWIRSKSIPDSPPAAIPGGGSMQLGEAGLRVTEDNINAERIYRVSAELTIDAGSAVGQARVRCQMRGGPGSELGRTYESRSAFPRSSGDYNLTKQDVPVRIRVKFHSQGAEYASLELEDAFDTFTDLPGVVVSWDTYNPKSMVWQWGLPEGRPAEPLRLGFATFWRSVGKPAAKISCTLESSDGAATVRTAGSL